MSLQTRRHFIIKHGLDAFDALPNYIWQVGVRERPHRFNQVRIGDRWIGFAYTTSDRRERSLSLVTGFYECVKDAWYGALPARGSKVVGGVKNGWMVRGTDIEPRLVHRVGVEPIEDILGKPTWKNQAILPITEQDFRRIKNYTLRHQFDPRRVPLLGREPTNEQEVLATVVCGHKQLGIERIIRVRKAFPDLMVKLKGRRQPVHLELEMYSKGFFSHRHDKGVRDCCFGSDGVPLAVVCWIDNCPEVKDKVHRVYELQALIRDKERIRW